MIFFWGILLVLCGMGIGWLLSGIIVIESPLERAETEIKSTVKRAMDEVRKLAE